MDPATGTRGCTVILSTATPAGPPAKRALSWSQSEVFVTPFGTLSTIIHFNLPGLTTVHTPSPSCVDRWMVQDYVPCIMDEDGSTISHTTPTIVWSIDPARSYVSDPAYSSCQLYGKAKDSPGVCPSRQTVAETTAYRSDVSTGYKTFWQASCCRRYGKGIAHLCDL